MDRKTQEVEIEARVVAATRSFARDIGTQLGFGWNNGTSSIGGTPAAMGLTTVPAGTIPLFSNLPATGPTSGLQIVNSSKYVKLDLILTMAESRGLLKVLSRPRIVTQNNIQAVVKQGVQLPVMSMATAMTPATITYIAAFLRLTVTPQITSEGTIFLNVDVENTLPDEADQINGNPALITQQATTQVLVTDGGTVVIGGVIQTQNNLTVQQVPLLGDIPYLGNLFKRRAVSTTTQELIFFITPRIIQT
jgi:type IV pilus assembly protein PilQ